MLHCQALCSLVHAGRLFVQSVPVQTLAFVKGFCWALLGWEGSGPSQLQPCCSRPSCHCCAGPEL